jgi:hypothetical protein
MPARNKISKLLQKTIRKKKDIGNWFVIALKLKQAILAVRKHL